MNRYVIDALPGLSGLVAEETNRQLGTRSKALGSMRNLDLLEVETMQPGGLLSLRLAEDIFSLLGNLPLEGQARDLAGLKAAAPFGGTLSRALPVWGRLQGKTLPARPVFRVVVQADDAAWRSYRRIDLQEAAEVAIMRLHAGWRLNRDQAPLEIWLRVVERRLVVALRLTTGQHRQRGGRAIERAAALRPTIAAAMVALTVPAPNDVFLDPMCGTGTILLERAVAGRYQQLLGGDNDRAAVEAALANFGPRHQPRRIVAWDARRLPLEDGGIDAAATNLPWGRQIGRPDELPDLYQAVLAELARVVRSGGRVVLLTSEWQLLKRLLKAGSDFNLERTIENIGVLGRRADIFVLRRS